MLQDDAIPLIFKIGRIKIYSL